MHFKIPIQNSILVVTTRPISKSPVLVIEGNERGLVITDLHIGFENKFFRNDIFIGKNTATSEILKEIIDIVDGEKPDYLILLGDVKSSIKSISKLEWDEIPKFMDKVSKKIETIIIPGNHDANIQKLIPEGVSLTNPYGMIIDNILLTHGHAMPLETFSSVDKIIMGHVHPVFFQDNSVLNGQRVWISLKTKKEQIFPSSSGLIEIIIMPSFNKYFFAAQKNTYRKSISPIIEKIKNVESAKIVTLDGSIIGNESMLEQLI